MVRCRPGLCAPTLRRMADCKIFLLPVPKVERPPQRVTLENDLSNVVFLPILRRRAGELVARMRALRSLIGPRDAQP